MADLFSSDGSPRTVIGYDIESHRIVPGRLVPRLVCLSLDGDGAPPVAVVEEINRYPRDSMIRPNNDGSWSALFGRTPSINLFPRLLSDPEIVLVAHNAPFDLAGLAEATHTTKGAPSLVTNARHPTIFDALQKTQPAASLVCTKVREQLIAIATDRLKFDPRTGKKDPPFDLAYLVQAHFGVDISEGKAKNCKVCSRVEELSSDMKVEPCSACGSWRLLYHRLDGVPVSEWPKDAQDYAIDDARWARLIAFAQGQTMLSDANAPIVTDTGHVVNEDEQLAAAYALHLMAANGPRTDAEAVDAWEAALVEAVAEIDAAGVRAGFVRTEGARKGSKDMKILYDLIERAYNGNPPRTDKGRVKTDRETLLGSAHPDLITFADPDANRKNLTTYVPILRRAGNHPLTSRPNALVSSGRCSWRDPSLHLSPRKGNFRECFVAREGNVYVSTDYDGIELRGLAQIQLWWFKRSAMADALIAGEDLHLSVGAQLLGVPYSAALEAYENESHPDHKRVAEARQIAKIANFGFPGGLAAQTFVGYAKQYGVDLTLERSEEIRNTWLERWPEMYDYFDLIGRATQWGSFTAVQLVSLRNRAGCSFTSGCNTYFQGLVADGAKAASVAVMAECFDTTSVLYRVRPWVMLHDEIIAEGPEYRLTEWAERKAQIMREQMQRFIPDVPVTCEPAAMRRWYKDAKTVRDKQGRIVPWEPKP